MGSASRRPVERPDADRQRRPDPERQMRPDHIRAAVEALLADDPEAPKLAVPRRLLEAIAETLPSNPALADILAGAVEATEKPTKTVRARALADTFVKRVIYEGVDPKDA